MIISQTELTDIKPTLLGLDPVLSGHPTWPISPLGA
jgi:hypothetical protein